MIRNKSGTFRVFLAVSFGLVVFVVCLWIHSYIRWDTFSVAVDHETDFRISSCYGVITIGTHRNSAISPSTGFFSEDPSRYDEAVMMARHVGIPMQTLREQPSFERDSKYFEVRGKHLGSTTISFPHWLLVVVFAAPWLCWSFVGLFRRFGRNLSAQKGGRIRLRE